MELRLQLEVRGQPDRDLAVEIDPDRPVADLGDAIAAHLGQAAGTVPSGLWSGRLSRWVAPGTPVLLAGLRSGDRLILGDPASTEPTTGPAAEGVVDLVVVGGPASGQCVPLGPGEHRVGGFRYSNVVVADPALSRIHFTVTVDALGRVRVADAGSESGTLLDARPIADAKLVEPGQLVTAGRSLIAFRQRPPSSRPGPALLEAPVDAAGRVAFNRPPRVVTPAPPTAYQLQPPPTKPDRQRIPLISSLLPLLMGVVMYFASGRQVYMLLMAAFSPVMAVGSIIEGRSGGRRRYREGVQRFRDRLQQLQSELRTIYPAVGDRLRSGAPDAAELARRAVRLEPGLWERRPHNPDFLRLRAGWGDRPSGLALEMAGGGDEGVRSEADGLLDPYRVVRTVPLTVDLRELGSVGIAGDRAEVTGLARWLALQVATLHSPEEAIIAAVVPTDQTAEWAWLGWLPHVHGENAPVPGPLVVSERAGRSLLERVLALVAERNGTSAGWDGPALVAVLQQDAGLPRGGVATLLTEGPAAGVYTVWLAGDASELPGECGATIEVDRGGGPFRMVVPATGERFDGAGMDAVPPTVALQVAQALAPLRDVSARGRGGSEIPRRVGLLELLGLEDKRKTRLLDDWIRDLSEATDSRLFAPIGRCAGGEPFGVSIRSHGPHALVGGTTGSGKSELLQTLVICLAARHSPRTLNFLLVDYKGGAAFKDCVDLPHTVGFVTDLDGHLVNRALVSLRAELRRREEILRVEGARDLTDLEQRRPDLAPPSLLIVVDEFAALVSELPEFVDGMVDVAQRGRSLGIHLVLATQRPQGVINDRIRANTNLRLSLRFSDDAESMDVIGTRDAARPGLPSGRAFARTGPGEVTEFQVAYAGGHSPSARGPAPIVVRDLGFGGDPLTRQDGPRSAGPGSSPDPLTDLVRLAAAIREVDAELALPPPPRPWLPTLPEVVPLAALPVQGAEESNQEPRAALGLLDEPALQRQSVVVYSPGVEGSLLVHGTSGSGKTVLLRTLAVALASSAGPEDLHLYALDYATRGLRVLEALPHCGAIINGDETERAVRLLGMLRGEGERRKALFAEANAATIAEYRSSHPGRSMPRILVLLDGFSGFIETLQDVDFGAHVDALRSLVAEGRPLGISFVITADRQVPFLMALSATIARKIVLRMATEDDYRNLGLPPSAFKDAHLPGGRGFTDRGLELQCALVGEDPSSAAQAAEVERIGAGLRGRFGAGNVPPVELLPVNLKRAALPPPGAALEAVIGLEDRTLGPASVDLSEGHLLVAGPRRTGRTTVIAAFADSLRRGGGVPLYLLSGRRQTALPELECFTEVALGPDACAALAGRIADRLRTAGPAPSPGIVVLIDDGDELLEGAGVTELEWLAQKGHELGVRIVAAVETQAAHRAFSGWLQQVLRERQGLLLDPDPALDGSLVGGVRLPQRQGTLPRGRGYLVRRGIIEIVQVAGG